MASLGSFGKRHDESEVVAETTFDYFGQEIHLSPTKFNELEFVDLMEKAGQVDENNPQAVTLIKDMFRLVLADEDREGMALRRAEIPELRARLSRAEHEDDRDRLLAEVAAAEAPSPYVGRGFDTFWSTAKKNRQEIEDLMPVYQALMEANTNRPTQQPSGSSDGLPITPQSYQPASSSEPAGPGRPDIQAMRDQSAADRDRILRAVAG